MKRRSVPKSTALALAVSLWIASGGAASAQDTVIEGDLFIGDAYGGKAESGSNAVGNTLTAKFSAITGDDIKYSVSSIACFLAVNFFAYFNSFLINHHCNFLVHHGLLKTIFPNFVPCTLT